MATPSWPVAMPPISLYKDPLIIIGTAMNEGPILYASPITDFCRFFGGGDQASKAIHIYTFISHD